MLNQIKKAIESIDSNSKLKPIKIITHFDTDGITSAAIFTRSLQRWGKKFSLEIVKSLDEEYLKKLPENYLLIFLDLASGSLPILGKKNTEIVILDHHEIVYEIPKNVLMINPHQNPKIEALSTSAITYLFAKSLSQTNKDLATLAVIGMVGDSQEKNIGKTFSEILQDAETIVKKGLLIYPSTRPLDKTLEYSSNPYIPGITGSFKGTIELLREAKIPNKDGKWKALYELTEEEMSNLVTSIILKTGDKINPSNLIGNLFLVKFFNSLEDARELSALINACSRMGSPEISFGFCTGNKKFKETAEEIYIKYKQSLMSALKYVSEAEKITGKNYTIINAKDKIKDTIIGTVASIISYSPLYPKGSIIIALAYDQDKIKVSARITGEEGKNVREVLHKVVAPLGGEVGGHPKAAGCIISREKEEIFLEELKKTLDIELVKI